jgi:Dyp-type peroxidase family
MHGMEHKGELLADPSRVEWESAYRDRLDALLLLACDDLQELNNKVGEAKKAIAAFGKVLQVETAKTHRRGKFAVEHFGFADGISQPKFFKGDTDQEAPKIVLEEDRLAGTPDAFGSYMVYRKLEQNVKGFLEDEARLADTLRHSGPDRERAGAMIVGRFRDGTPLTKSGTPGTVPEEELNDFDYTEGEGDDGSRCPMHAHVRKVRPRGRVHYPRERMVRRGVTYGPYDPTKQKSEPPEKGSGLLFLSFQRNIESQFGRVQSEWANAVHAPEEHAGQDPMGGQGWVIARQSWPWEWGKQACLNYRFGKYMKLLGGEFFFAPSLAFFNKLK